MRVRLGFLLLIICTFFYANPVGGAFLRQHVQMLPWMNPHDRLMAGLHYSPVRICDITNISAGVYHSRLFQVRELQMLQITGALPFSFGNLGVEFMQFGDELYLEQTFAGLFGTEFTQEFRAGAAIRNYNLSIAGYGAASAIGVDLGASWTVIPELRWELAYSNMNQAAIGRDPELLPQQIYSSLQYEPSDIIRGQTYLVHELGTEIRYGAGSAIRPFPWITCAVDFITAPLRGSYGITLQWKLLHITYVATSHPVLPFTHRLGVLFTL